MDAETQRLLLDALGAGWDGLENAGDIAKAFSDRAQAADDEQRRREVKIVRDMVRTPQGKAFMTWLLQKTLVRPPSQIELSATTAEAYSIAKARREGQSGIAFMLLFALAADDETEQPMENEP